MAEIVPGNCRAFVEIEAEIFKDEDHRTPTTEEQVSTPYLCIYQH